MWKSIKKNMHLFSLVIRHIHYQSQLQYNFNWIEIVESKEKRRYSIILESDLSQLGGHTNLISGHFHIEHTQKIIMMIIIDIDRKTVDNRQSVENVPFNGNSSWINNWICEVQFFRQRKNWPILNFHLLSIFSNGFQFHIQIVNGF